jgi:geranylgeranyl diphosphate synthase type I
MSGSSLEVLSRIGRKVDPEIYTSLVRGSPPEFLPSLSYHFRVGGKRMRAALVMLACAASGGLVQNALKPAAAVEMIHNYSLVMDDIIDHGLVRRGKATVRVRLGDSVSLLVAMFYREVLDDLIQECARSTEIRRIAVQSMKEIIDGERLDLLFEQAGREDPYLRSNRISDPSLRLYLVMIGKKTASLFRAASEIGAHSAQAKSRVIRALGVFGWKAGLAFQVMDDVLDICGHETGKQKAKDVIEHKLGNAAILVGLRFLSPTNRREFMEIIRSRNISKGMAERARQLIVKTPAEIACREVARRYLDDAKNQLSVLQDSSYKESLMQLSDRFLSRTY